MKTHFSYAIKALAFALSLIFVLPPSVGQDLPTQLNIVVVEGEGAINNVKQRVTREPIVRVEDENHRPIAGAAVVFTLPTEGATGEFGGGAKTLTVMTDDRGLAAAKGLKPNQVSGKLPIHITASYRGMSARSNITQINEGVPGATAKSGGGGGKIIAILAIVGAAAAGGAYYATHQKSS